jgi:ABC-type Zn uptake system ZnuABC Zn-binding protein ZnuA
MSQLFSKKLNFLINLYRVLFLFSPLIQGTIKISSSLPQFSSLIKEIGGDQVEVKTLFRYGTNPHDFELTPQDCYDIIDSDIIVIHGGQLDLSLDQFISSISNNKEYKAIEINLLMLKLCLPKKNSEFYKIKNHLSTDPTSIVLLATKVLDELILFDDENSSYYLNNYSNFYQRYTKIESLLNKAKNKKYLVALSTPIYNMMMEELGYEIMSVEGLHIGCCHSNYNISQKKLLEFIDSCQERKPNLVIIEKGTQDPISSYLREYAQKNNIKILEVEELMDSSLYRDIVDWNIKLLETIVS